MGMSENQKAVLVTEIKPNLEKLHMYSKFKLALAGQLRIVRQAFETLGREKAGEQYKSLMIKLAEDRFTLAVLGQFKRGKSSLMNAIIGRELLPTGVLPLTSAITVLKYGPVERFIVRYENSGLPDEVPLSLLADYVTEKGNPSNRKQVQTAYVELPVPFLRRGVEFVDTPGVGSAIAANTTTTYSFLPECDAVLFVTSVDTPLTSLEIAFLKDIREYVAKIFFVINKIDLVAECEREDVVKFVTDTIQTQVGYKTVKVFPVSARQGIRARMAGVESLYEESGLKDLEDGLADFLSAEKSMVFLTGITRKALEVLNQEVSQNVFTEAALQVRADFMKNEPSSKLRRDPQMDTAAALAAKVKIEALYKELLTGQDAEISQKQAAVSYTLQTNIKAASAMNIAPLATEIAADLKTRGCPVCKHVADTVSHFLAHWQYKISCEEKAQEEFAASLGFCPLHTWQLLSMSSPYGASLGYAQLVDNIVYRLKKADAMDIKHEPIYRLVQDVQTCHVCSLVQQVEQYYVQRLAVMIDKIADRSLYQGSQGVCLRHLGMLLESVNTVESGKFLLNHAIQKFEEDAEDMRSYALKHETTRRALQNCDEQDAYRRAVTRIVGDRNVCAPWKMDGRI